MSHRSSFAVYRVSRHIEVEERKPGLIGRVFSYYYRR